VEYIPFRFWKGTGSIQDIRLPHRIINGAMPDGFDIHPITHPMNTMIGVIEVSTTNAFFLRDDFRALGYALALGNFNNDDNQGKELLFVVFRSETYEDIGVI
jgi:hypothetical protein